MRHWAQGGPTTLSNLTLLCRWHHRVVHEDGYCLDRAPDGTLRFRRPDGRPLPEVPSDTIVRGDPVQKLRARHEAQGLRLHAGTTRPGWLGERLDLGYAIDVLHPLATREAALQRAPTAGAPARPLAAVANTAVRVEGLPLTRWRLFDPGVRGVLDS